jgi:hypothetical protein
MLNPEPPFYTPTDHTRIFFIAKGYAVSTQLRFRVSDAATDHATKRFTNIA